MATLVVFLLFFLPFYILPFGQSYFEIPKVFLAEAVIFIIVVLFLLKKRIKTIKLNNKLFIIISSFFILLIIQYIFLRSNTFLFGNQFRLQGAILFLFLGIFSLLSSQIDFKIPKWAPLLSLIGLSLGACFFGVDENGRIIGFLGEPNALAAAGIFLWPVIYYQAKSKTIKTVALVLAMMLIVISSSRSAAIALVIQLIFIIINRKYVGSLLRPTIISLLLIIFSLSLPILRGGGWFENRAEIWQTAFFAGFTSPFIGNGFGNIEKILPEVSVTLNNNVQYQYIDSSHNFLLDFWVQGGTVGLLLILLLLFFTFSNLILSNKKLEAVLLIGLLSVMSFNPVSVVTLIQFWWLIGQSYNNQFI